MVAFTPMRQSPKHIPISRPAYKHASTPSKCLAVSVSHTHTALQYNDKQTKHCLAENWHVQSKSFEDFRCIWYKKPEGVRGVVSCSLSHGTKGCLQLALRSRWLRKPQPHDHLNSNDMWCTAHAIIGKRSWIIHYSPESLTNADAWRENCSWCARVAVDYCHHDDSKQQRQRNPTSDICKR